MPISQVKLSFESLHDLWRFVQRIGATCIEMNWRELSLICACSEPELLLAAKEFKLVQYDTLRQPT